MKKTYTKPVLMMEDFTLSQSIAHNCGKNLDWEQATLKYRGSCGWDLDGLKDTAGDVLFMDTHSVCTLQTHEASLVCYNNPEGGWEIFNS